MRHIHNAVCRKCAGRQEQKKKQNAYGRRFHRRENNPSDQSSNGIVFQSVVLMIFILIPMLFAARNVAPQLATPNLVSAASIGAGAD
jgi:ssDNA-binding Zn-finger/Zn-ribbon topoisomerase 1